MDAMNVVVLAGPNGAGKSTTAKKVIRDQLGIHHYVNADTLARGLSEFASEHMAMKAGRIMLEHLHDLAREKVDFGFETTLSGKSYARMIDEWKKQGYIFHLIFLWLPSAEMALNRVKVRLMNANGKRSVVERMQDTEGMERAMAEAIRETVREHKLLGFPIVVWQDGKVVEIPPEQIELEGEETGPRD